METDLAVGASFRTYDDFEIAFTKYKKRTNTVFVKADSKTVGAENKKLKDSIAPYPSEHRFRYVRFNCKHFGDMQQDSRPSKRGVVEGRGAVDC